MKITIAGTAYNVFYQKSEENEKFSELEISGYTDVFSKEIFICKHERDDIRNVKDMDGCELKILQHEIIHALMYECGQTDYWDDERIVDTISILMDKIALLSVESFECFKKLRGESK